MAGTINRTHFGGCSSLSNMLLAFFMAYFSLISLASCMIS